MSTIQQCDPGHILAYSAAGISCNPCPPGTYEVERALCKAVDSFHFIPLPGQDESGKVPCSTGSDFALRTRHMAVSMEGSVVTVEPQQGAQRREQCACQPGAYSLAAFGNVSAPNATSNITGGAIECLACPEGAVCLGGLVKPYAEPGYGVLEWDESLLVSNYLSRGLAGFYPCLGSERCPGEDCDCLGGSARSEQQVAVAQSSSTSRA